MLLMSQHLAANIQPNTAESAPIFREKHGKCTAGITMKYAVDP
jgi:hypothetical protein